MRLIRRAHGVQEARPRHHRRAASLWRRAAAADHGEGRESQHAGDDRDADSAHSGDDDCTAISICRSSTKCRRAHADPHDACHRSRCRTGLPDDSRRNWSKAGRLRRVSGDRRIGKNRSEIRDRRIQETIRNLQGPPGGAAARPSEERRERSDDGCLRRGRDSMCSFRRR